MAWKLDRSVVQLLDTASPYAPETALERDVISRSIPQCPTENMADDISLRADEARRFSRNVETGWNDRRTACVHFGLAAVGDQDDELVQRFEERDKTLESLSKFAPKFKTINARFTLPKRVANNEMRSDAVGAAQFAR